MFINRTIWSHCFIWWLWKEVKAEENTKNHCLADGYYKLKMRYRVWIWELINFFAKIFRLKQSTVWIMDLQSRWRPRGKIFRVKLFSDESWASKFLIVSTAKNSEYFDTISVLVVLPTYLPSPVWPDCWNRIWQIVFQKLPSKYPRLFFNEKWGF